LYKGVEKEPWGLKRVLDIGKTLRIEKSIGNWKDYLELKGISLFVERGWEVGYV
jgi:hypothetical protein